MNVITIVMVVFYTIFTVLSVILVWRDVLSYITIVVFFGLGIGFLSTGLMMIVSLKSYFPDYYDGMRVILRRSARCVESYQANVARSL